MKIFSSLITGPFLESFIKAIKPANPSLARFRSGVFWSMLNVVISQPLALLTTIATARLLGIDGFGQFSITRSTVLMLGVFAGTGLGIAATRHVAEFCHSNPERAGRIASLLITLGAIFGSLGFLLTYLFSSKISYLIHDETISALLTFASPLILLNILNGIYIGILSGLEKYKQILIIGVIEGFCMIAFVTVGAYIYQGIGAVIGMVVSAFISLIFRYFIVRYECIKMNIQLNISGIHLEARLLTRVALPAVLIAASIQPFEWIGRVLISNGGANIGEVGVFSVVHSWAQFMTVVPAQVTVPSMAILASLYASKDYINFRKLVLSSFKVVGILSIVLAFPLVILSEWILNLYGPEFIVGVPALRVMLLAYSVTVVSMVITEALVASDRVWLHASQKFLWGGVMITFAYFLTPMGSIGLAISYASANFVFLVIQAFALKGVFSELANSSRFALRE